MFQVCLIWGSGTPATTTTGCCLSSQDFSLCLTRRCQKELPRPCTRDATVLRQLCLMFVWSGVQALLQWLRRAAKYLSRLQHMFSTKMTKRTSRPCSRDATVPEHLYFIFVWSGVQALIKQLLQFADFTPNTSVYVWPKDPQENSKAL